MSVEQARNIEQEIDEALAMSDQAMDDAQVNAEFAAAHEAGLDMAAPGSTAADFDLGSVELISESIEQQPASEFDLASVELISEGNGEFSFDDDDLLSESIEQQPAPEFDLASVELISEGNGEFSFDDDDLLSSDESEAMIAAHNAVLSGGKQEQDSSAEESPELGDSVTEEDLLKQIEEPYFGSDSARSFMAKGESMNSFMNGLQKPSMKEFPQDQFDRAMASSAAAQNNPQEAAPRLEMSLGKAALLMGAWASRNSVRQLGRAVGLLALRSAITSTLAKMLNWIARSVALIASCRGCAMLVCRGWMTAVFRLMSARKWRTSSFLTLRTSVTSTA
ncbi:hypothetical protein QM298_22720 [Pseudomonas mendocina]|nr:hypothetical protein [Pseudomonas mendocina]MDV5863639.1 hypothetical protein [Pseudomonas mendocina]